MRGFLSLMSGVLAVDGVLSYLRILRAALALAVQPVENAAFEPHRAPGVS